MFGSVFSQIQPFLKTTYPDVFTGDSVRKGSNSGVLRNLSEAGSDGFFKILSGLVSTLSDVSAPISKVAA